MDGWLGQGWAGGRQDVWYLPLLSYKWWAAGSDMVGKYNGHVVLMDPRSQVLVVLCLCFVCLFVLFFKKNLSSLCLPLRPALWAREQRKPSRVSGADDLAWVATLGSPPQARARACPC